MEQGKRINPNVARKIISLFGCSSEVRFKIATISVETKKKKSEIERFVEEEYYRRHQSPKKIEGFLVCPVCGTHKKLNKAPFDGAGSRVRQIKENRNKKAQLVAKTEGIEIPEKLFKERKYQEHLLKYLSPEALENDVIPEIVEEVTTNFKLPDRYYAVQSSTGRILLSEYIDSFFFQHEEGHTIIRQPFFNNDFSLSKTKFISIRLNFGNRRAGLQKKILLSSLAIAEVIKGIKSGILLNVIEKAIEEMPPEKADAIRQKLCSYEEEVSETASSLLEEALEESLKEKETEEEKPKETKQPEIPDYEVNLFDEEEGLFGDYDKLKEIVELLFPNEFGDYVFAGDLFPKVRELVEEARSGFQEVFTLSIADAIFLYTKFKGKSIQEAKQMIEESLALFGLNDTPISEEDVVFFFIFLAYIRIQLQRLREIAKSIYEHLEKI